MKNKELITLFGEFVATAIIFGGGFLLAAVMVCVG